MSKKGKIIVISSILILIALALIIVGVVLGCVIFKSNREEIAPDKYKKEWSNTLAFDIDDCKSVIIPSGDEPRILQLTDIHYDMNNNKKEQTLELIKTTIKEANPHVITVTGDWSSERKGTLPLVREVFDTIDSFNIPWAPVFGNHDMEGDLSRYDYADIFSGYKNCLFSVGYTNIGGVGNYIVNLFEKSIDDNYIGSLFMLDSNTSVRVNVQKYIGLSERQVEWYKWAVDGLNREFSKNGESVKSLMYIHVPLNEYKEVSGEPIFGENGEGVWPPYKNTGMFDAILEKGSTKAVFCGHDHANNAVYNYKGVLLGYGIESGWCKGYAEDSKKGGTLVTLGDNFDIKISHVLYEYK